MYFYFTEKVRRFDLQLYTRLGKESEIPDSHEDSWRHVRPSLTDLLSGELLKEGLKGDTLGNLTEENSSSTGEATVH